MRYAAFYGRYSSERQNEQSIEGQLNICEKYAEQNGLKIVETYIEPCQSGTDDHALLFKRCLPDCEKMSVELISFMRDVLQKFYETQT